MGLTFELSYYLSSRAGNICYWLFANDYNKPFKYKTVRNLTEYNDQFILDLIKQVNGNPYKCTANVQYAVGFNKLIPVLVIYQDYSTGWDYDERQIFCENKEAVDFCLDNYMTLADLKAMQEYYSTVGFQQGIDDAEYEKECEEYERALYEEYSWYVHARQMGWE